MKVRIIVLVLLLLVCKSLTAREKPALSSKDRIRLAEAFRLADTITEGVWKDWTKAPFAVLLVTQDYEFLLRQPSPSTDFIRLGYDSLLRSDIYYRKRVFDPHLLATFPAVSGSGISTIVVGQAENTAARTSTPWVVMLLHEHFHQLQYSQPNYYVDVAALNLARGDQTGMWMLNFPFPYAKKGLREEFRRLSLVLADALQASRMDQLWKLEAYLRERQKFQQRLTPDEARYFEFQFWQEGIARYTEYHIARLAGSTFKVSKDFRTLPDYSSFEQTATNIYTRIIRQLRTQKLEESKREVVYPFGAAEGLLLDMVSPGWKTRYFADRFALVKYYPLPATTTVAGGSGAQPPE
jgi:hypothetical protein